MDRRQIKTRKAVFKAFVSLLDEKAYSAITIQDILERADIGRSTFYAHFKTKDDLLDAICVEIFEHVFSSHPHEETTHDFSEEHGLVSELTHVLYHIKDSKGYVVSILASDGAEVFMRYFREHLTAIFEKEIKTVSDGIPRSYYITYLVAGFIETARWWMGSELSQEEMMGLYCALYLKDI